MRNREKCALPKRSFIYLLLSHRKSSAYFLSLLKIAMRYTTL